MFLEIELILIFTDEMAAKLPTFDELLKDTVESFEKLYKSRPNLAACAPGRVNLIGEHIDYCDGFVLPMASTRLFPASRISFVKAFLIK